MNKKTMALFGLVAAVAVTGSSVSGTYAKYVSQIDLTDEARVAKFNLVAAGNCEGNLCRKIEKLDLFGSSYTKTGTESGQTIYVKAINDEDKKDNLVAPGTEGEYQVAFVGAMEVRHDFKVYFSAEKDKNNIEVYYKTNKAGEVLDPETEISYDSKYKNAEGWATYSPIVYTVVLGDGEIGKEYVRKTGTLAEVTEALRAWSDDDAQTGENIFAPGRLGELNLVISWKWDTINKVTNLTDDDVNVLDTYLANNWYKIVPVGTSDLGDTITFTLDVSATQITAADDTKDPSTNSKPVISNN